MPSLFSFYFLREQRLLLLRYVGFSELYPNYTRINTPKSIYLRRINLQKQLARKGLREKVRALTV